jgi:hypothetical protein
MIGAGIRIVFRALRISDVAAGAGRRCASHLLAPDTLRPGEDRRRHSNRSVLRGGITWLLVRVGDALRGCYRAPCNSFSQMAVAMRFALRLLTTGMTWLLDRVGMRSQGCGALCNLSSSIQPRVSAVLRVLKTGILRVLDGVRDLLVSLIRGVQKLLSSVAEGRTDTVRVRDQRRLCSTSSAIY